MHQMKAYSTSKKIRTQHIPKMRSSEVISHLVPQLVKMVRGVVNMPLPMLRLITTAFSLINIQKSSISCLSKRCFVLDKFNCLINLKPFKGYDLWYIIYHISYIIYHMIYDIIWYMIWYDMIWYDMIWYDMNWYKFNFRSFQSNCSCSLFNQWHIDVKRVSRASRFSPAGQGERGLWEWDWKTV